MLLTRADKVKVKVKAPLFVISPRDVVVAENSDVLFQCEVSGTPQPVVVWKKIDGQIPAERFGCT